MSKNNIEKEIKELKNKVERFKTIKNNLQKLLENTENKKQTLAESLDGCKKKLNEANKKIEVQRLAIAKEVKDKEIEHAKAEFISDVNERICKTIAKLGTAKGDLSKKEINKIIYKTLVCKCNKNKFSSRNNNKIVSSTDDNNNCSSTNNNKIVSNTDDNNNVSSAVNSESTILNVQRHVNQGKMLYDKSIAASKKKKNKSSLTKKKDKSSLTKKKKITRIKIR